MLFSANIIPSQTVSIGSLTDMEAFAHRLAPHLQAGDVLCLRGDLGAGKTTFSRLLVRALGLPDPVSSPTFTLLHEYTNGQLPVYHMDAYRLRDETEAEDAGLADYLTQADGITLVEWPERIEALLPPNSLNIRFQLSDTNANDEARTLTLTAHGPRWEVAFKQGTLC